MTTIETLKEQYNALKTEKETLQTELNSLNDLYKEVEWIYAQIKNGVTEINLIQETDDEDNVISSNQDQVDKWNNRWTKIGEFTTLLEITTQDMVENLIRSNAITNSMSTLMNNQMQDLIREKEDQIREKDVVLESTQTSLKEALFEAEGIE
jgi:predicted  nucleic acid-binding Zn-ribbon protein